MNSWTGNTADRPFLGALVPLQSLLEVDIISFSINGNLENMTFFEVDHQLTIGAVLASADIF